MTQLPAWDAKVLFENLSKSRRTRVLSHMADIASKFYSEPIGPQDVNPAIIARIPLKLFRVHTGLGRCGIDDIKLWMLSHGYEEGPWMVKKDK